MSDTQWLKKKRRGWYVRVKVPADLRDELGKTEILRTLKTSDLRVAQRLRLQTLADIHDEFESLRRARTGDREHILHVAREHAKVGGEGAELGFDAFSEQYRHRDELTPAIRLGYKLLSGSTTGLLATDALELHLAEIKKRVIKQTVNARRKRCGAFLEYVGIDTLLEDVTRKQAGQYLTERLLPAGKSVKTNKDTVVDIGAFFRWCRDRGYIDNDPFAGLSGTIKASTRGTSDGKRRPFTDTELLHYFATIRDKKGKESAEFAIAAVCLYTGARPDEVCNLRSKDCTDGVIRIREGKSDAAVRVIPVHPDLQPVVDQWLAKEKPYLLGDMPEGGEDNKRWSVMGKRLGYLLRTNAGITDPLVVTYSLRKNYATALEDAGVSENIAQQLMGHEKGSLSYGLYSRGASIDVLRAAVSRLRFPEVLL